MRECARLLCFGNYHICNKKGFCNYDLDCKIEYSKIQRSLEKQEGVFLNFKTSSRLYTELDKVSSDVKSKLATTIRKKNGLMTVEDIQQFEIDKNDIISKLNKLSMDLKIECENNLNKEI
ncbi:MAG: hypothetical protein ACRCX8_05270 [Sarcina sp.]